MEDKIKATKSNCPNFVYVDGELRIEKNYKKKRLKELTGEINELNKQIKGLEKKRKTAKKYLNTTQNLTPYCEEDVEIE